MYKSEHMQLNMNILNRSEQILCPNLIPQKDRRAMRIVLINTIFTHVLFIYP